MQNIPEISVIIPTFNRAQSLADTLLALANQTLDKNQYELIVVDDGSTDDTAQSVYRFACSHKLLNLHYERHNTNRSKAAACNTGIKVSSGRLVAFTDDDIRPIPIWLEAHIQRHQAENRAVSVTGLVLYPEAWEIRSNWVKYGNDNYKKNINIKPVETGGLPPSRFAGGNLSIPRDTIIAAGLFNEELRRGEDGDLACRLHEMGVPLIFEPRALVYHYAEAINSIDSTLQSFRQFYERDRVILKQRYPWFFAKTGHWFLEPIDSGIDNLLRKIIKFIVMLISNHSISQIVICLLKRVDGTHWLYCRPLYQYVMVCTALEAIRASERG
jgi:glycosyltransferase involved in cell wall biosynthesis